MEGFEVAVDQKVEQLSLNQLLRCLKLQCKRLISAVMDNWFARHSLPKANYNLILKL